MELKAEQVERMQERYGHLQLDKAFEQFCREHVKYLRELYKDQTCDGGLAGIEMGVALGFRMAREVDLLAMYLRRVRELPKEEVLMQEHQLNQYILTKAQDFLQTAKILQTLQAMGFDIAAVFGGGDGGGGGDEGEAKCKPSTTHNCTGKA